MEKDYESFVFYASWEQMLEGFDEETAKEILWQIMKYGIHREVTTDNPMIKGIVLGAVAPNIDKAKQRYTKAVEDGKKGGRPKTKITPKDAYLYRQQGKTTKEIAELFDCSEATVLRRIREYNEYDEYDENTEGVNSCQNPSKPVKTKQNLEEEEEEEEEVEEEIEEENDGEAASLQTKKYLMGF